MNDDAPPYSPATQRIRWARLLKRVFDIDIEHCPYRGGALKIIAAILEKAAITKILGSSAESVGNRKRLL